MPQTIDGFGLMAELQLTPHSLQRMLDCLTSRPVLWSELSDIGHRSRVGQQYREQWTDYRTPVGFLGVRQFIGTRLVVDAAAAHGFSTSDEPITWLLESRAPVRHISHTLTQQLLVADAVIPWPGLKAPYPSVLVMVPRGTCIATVSNTEPDELVAVAIHCRDGVGGLELRWSAYGWNGAVWSDGWSVKPLLEYPISRLAWGVIAVLNTSIDIEASVAPSAPGGGVIRSKRERPEPLWVQPRRHLIRPSRPTEPTGESRAPHWRAAHPHRFWIGKKDGKRKLVTHWLPAIWVDPALQGDN
jgi:hypothetical protein